ncbi:MAG: enoyl-CoA hydratase-related protein [Chloroflexi bacterium]|nr:enoyl-CoA hydratase-related protein [Chloroflexota bacterium]MDA1003371.1 enoyl-CoA hydratase-related protein [Chloroflexota bacterium]
MAYEFAMYEKKGHIAYVTINRPEVMNSLHAPANYELSGIWDEFAADDDAWVAILTGAGARAFSAGNDLKATAAGTNRLADGVLPRKGGFGGITDRWDLFKPVIAAVNGWAMGGGCEMALACDIVIASENARFGLPEPRVGLFAGAGGIHRLPRQIPLKIAMGMMLTGKDVDARAAERYGLVNEVVPQDQLMETAEKWAAWILECAPLSVRGTKEGSMRGLEIPLESAMSRSYYWLQRHNSSDDRVEGPRAFSEKRQPNWSGA